MTQAAAKAVDDLVVEPVLVSYSLATPLGQLPAETIFDTGGDVRDLLARLASASQRDRKTKRVQWRAREEGEGRAVLQPVSEPDLAAHAANSLIHGLQMAEHEASLHSAWDVPAANIAERLTRRLGETAGTGLEIGVRATGEPELDAVVTRRAARHLHEATKLTITSYGSVLGVLGRVSVRPRRRASLWSDLDGRRIDVHFGPGDEETVRTAWAKDRVEVIGVIHENSAGQVLRIDMDRLVVHEPSGLRWADLKPGSYPAMTGGRDTLDYLDLIRGEKQQAAPPRLPRQLRGALLPGRRPP